MSRFSSPRRALFALILISTSGAALADTPADTGLGQSWPNAPDVSASPNFHVYRFERSGVRYVQVNDASGTVRGAIATVDGQVLELPVGVDASHWSTADTSATAGDVVYNDGSVKVSVAPQSDGSARLMATPSTTNNCGNPIICGGKSP